MSFEIAEREAVDQGSLAPSIRFDIWLVLTKCLLNE